MVLDQYGIDAFLTVHNVDPDTGAVHAQPDHQIINETAYLDLKEELRITEHNPEAPIATVQYSAQEGKFYFTEIEGWHDIIVLINNIPVRRGQTFPLSNPSHIDIEIVVPARNKFSKFYQVTFLQKPKTFIEKVKERILGHHTSSS